MSCIFWLCYSNSGLAAALGNLFKMQIHRPHSRPTYWICILKRPPGNSEAQFLTICIIRKKNLSMTLTISHSPFSILVTTEISFNHSSLLSDGFARKRVVRRGQSPFTWPCSLWLYVLGFLVSFFFFFCRGWGLFLRITSKWVDTVLKKSFYSQQKLS